MVLIKKVVKYLLANPFYSAVVVVCGIAILAVILAICVKASKAKKTTAPPQTQTQPNPDVLVKEPTPLTQTTTNEPVENFAVLDVEEVKEVPSPTQSIKNTDIETNQSSELVNETSNFDIDFSPKVENQQTATIVSYETASTEKAPSTTIQKVKEENVVEVIE